MNPTGHADLGPELRQLAQAILDRIDPALRAAAMVAAARATEGPGRCQQLWCPVCALAALVTGEEHPLLTVISQHSVALLAVVRALLDDERTEDTPAAPEPTTEPTPDPSAPDPTPTGRYQPIHIDIDE
ncbi:Uncharacterised protein [Mycolicibacterium tokaiense]|uniref:Uncharacterized protein n=2 Tax=Mycolicibacterium tokaiense TaxID=39695 RepID=A0A378TMR0_9MYCO|nr:hypothetical protein MTOK_54960 [Mycolicibacterium tokaiense]STZ61900.1 Uncharacterised protein [Mycolicibacterium tokaiense]